jgi:hypothetical protein
MKRWWTEFWDNPGRIAFGLLILFFVWAGTAFFYYQRRDFWFPVAVSCFAAALFFVVQRAFDAHYRARRNPDAERFFGITRRVSAKFYLTSFPSAELKSTGEPDAVSWSDVRSADALSNTIILFCPTATFPSFRLTKELELGAESNTKQTCFFIGLYTNKPAIRLFRDESGFLVNVVEPTGNTASHGGSIELGQDPGVDRYDRRTQSLINSHPCTAFTATGKPVEHDSYALVCKRCYSDRGLTNFWVGGNDPWSTREAADALGREWQDIGQDLKKRKANPNANFLLVYRFTWKGSKVLQTRRLHLIADPW